MLKIQLVAAALLASLSVQAEEIILDCSPPAGVGFNREVEKIYLNNAGTLAVYTHLQRGQKPYSVAFSAGSRKAVVQQGQEPVDLPDGIYTGIGMNDDAMQITLKAKESSIVFQRNADDYGQTLECLPNKREVDVDWTEVQSVVNAAKDNGGSTLF
jgi:hypothetical protein